MLTLYIHVPYASFRKSYARSFGETYPLPPPATVYGMLLSLVGECFRARHSGVRLAFAYKCRRRDIGCGERCLPPIASTLRKLSRFKYGVGGKEGAKPDYIETVCGIEFLCWVDSSDETRAKSCLTRSEREGQLSLEDRIALALSSPHTVNRHGVLCLGLSDDGVNDVSICHRVEGAWHRLLPTNNGSIELPRWVDHVGSRWTRWQRYEFEPTSSTLQTLPGEAGWFWTRIVDPRINEKLSSQHG